MFIKLKFYFFLLILLTIFTSCSVKKQTIDKLITQDAINWEGYYYGKISKDVNVWLRIYKFDGKVLYDLTKNLPNNKQKTTYGTAQWNNNTSILTLMEDNKKVFVGEGFLSFIQTNKNIIKDNKLLKYEAYGYNGKQLLVNPDEITDKKIDNEHIIYLPGIINFEHTSEAGHKSLKAYFIIYCAKNKYKIPKIAYYKDSFLGGGKIEESQGKNENLLPLNELKILWEFTKDYCLL